MKHKTTELVGPLLDAAVAMAEGIDVASVDDIGGCKRACADGVPRYYCPSGMWEEGGPIIERERIMLGFREVAPIAGGCVREWTARQFEGEQKACGPTPLIAAMRAYVASKLGEEVELP